MCVSAAKLTAEVVKVSSAASSGGARRWSGNQIVDSATQAGGGTAPVDISVSMDSSSNTIKIHFK